MLSDVLKVVDHFKLYDRSFEQLNDKLIGHFDAMT